MKAQDSDSIVLAPHYYRDNFLRLCDTVDGQYSNILTLEETQWLTCFRALTFTAQCLYIRLISRVGPWFRESKLHYEELGDLQESLNELLAQELATEAELLSAEELGRLYTQKELRQIFADRLKGTKLQGKASLLAAIEELAHEDQTLVELLAGFEQGRLIAPLAVENVELLQLLFFGNRHQSLTEFILEDLGLTRYYPYTLDRDYRFFTCREALEEYLNCAALSDQHYELRDQDALDQLPALGQQVLAVSVRYPSTESRWQRLCNGLGRDLERQKEWDIALQLYSRSQRHPARERSARVFEAQQDWPAAKILCGDILSSPWCEAEREAAEKILPRVQRKLDGSKQTKPRDTFTNVHLSIENGTDCVELLTAAHLASQWKSVHYVENSLMNTLFGLAFWEQIFATVPGAFHHPYQGAPADMYEAAFRERRSAAIDARFDELNSGDIAEILSQAYDRYAHYQCYSVNWRHIDAALVTAAATVIPAAHLIAIWERMLFDLAENRSGFPDLIALGSVPGDYCLIEVKGPGDALQNSQKRWLRFFQQQQIPAQIAWIEWQDD
jgi:hypothetical protein